MSSSLVIRILVLIGVAPAVIFPVYYTLTGRWWSSPEGRHLFAFSAVAALALCNSAILVFFVDYPGRQVVRYALTIGIVYVLWQRLWVYWNARRKFKRHYKEQEEVQRAKVHGSVSGPGER